LKCDYIVVTTTQFKLMAKRKLVRWEDKGLLLGPHLAKRFELNPIKFMCFHSFFRRRWLSRIQEQKTETNDNV